jgi:threonine/homoserine/homoserine lactone efflux protein
MIDPSRLTVFCAACIAIAAVPGPAVLYIVTRSVEHGRRAGLASAGGAAGGATLQTVGAAAGLASLLIASSTAFNAVKYTGAAYLVFMGVRRLLSGKVAELDAGTPTPDLSLRRVFAQGVVVNLLNPKVTLFLLAFLPQFVDPARGSESLQIAVLGAIFVTIGLASDTIYAIIAGTAADWLRKRRRFARMQRYVAGTVFIGLGVTAALTGSARRG